MKLNAAPGRVAVLAAAALLATGPAAAAAAAAPGWHRGPFGRLGPQNPFAAGGGVGAPHSSTQSSDASPQRGPGSGSSTGTFVPGAACATILLDRRGHPIVQCTDKVVPQPDGTLAFIYSLRLLDPETFKVLSSYTLPLTGQNGVYYYLDRRDRVVIATGDGHVLRIAHGRTAGGQWRTSVVDDWDVSDHVTGRCGGSSLCDYIVSVKPDWRGRIWFSTTEGVVGTLNTWTGTARSIRLPDGEQVTKAMSTSWRGAAVVSTHALYFLRASWSGKPRIVWRETYDRGGSDLKPGQMVDGTGTSPSFFGPGDDRYVTITDNAEPREHVLVYRVRKDRHKQLICRVPVFAPGASGTDDTSMTAGRSVIAVNTYGYDYFDYTPIPLPGGITRIDVRSDGSGCSKVWTNPTSTITMAKLSVRSGKIYTFERTVTDSTPTYSFVVIDAHTGRTLNKLPLGNSVVYEGLQLNGTIGRDGSFYQGTLGGLVRITPTGR